MAKTIQPPAQGGRGGAPQPPPADPKFNWPAKPAVIGTHVKRLDGPEKVTGRARYTFDINRPGMLYGRIVRSPYPHARIVSVDLSAARRAPGVKAALVWREPENAQRNTVMFQGDEVAAVAADTEEHAIDAARLVKVDYEVLPHVVVVDQALSGSAPAVFQGGNFRPGQTAENGDLAAGFKAAAFTLEETYATHVITHVCMESHGTVCEWDGDKLTAWVTTQGINSARDGFASGLSIPQANVRVITQYMGGGFGSKMGPDAQGLICARLAKEANAPVKLMLDRKEEHLATGNRPSAAARIKAGVSADGIITAFDAESWGTGGAGAAAGFPLPYIYQITNRRRAHKDVFINTGQQRPMRAPGHPQGSFITEVMMEELADKVKMDPVEFRIKNLPPEAPNAMWGSYLKRGASGVRLGQAAPDGRHDARSDQDRHGRRDQHVGRRRPWPVAGALRDRLGRRSRREDRHAGSRHRHTDARGGCRRRDARAAAEPDPAGDRRYELRRERRVGRQHDGGRHQPRDSDRHDERPRRAEREGRTGARRGTGAARRRRRAHPREGQPGQGRVLGRRLQADRPAGHLRWTATGSRGSRR